MANCCQTVRGNKTNKDQNEKNEWKKKLKKKRKKKLVPNMSADIRGH